jgi:ABC-type dipeptide/oligopeptide/nickel transport system permease component
MLHYLIRRLLLMVPTLLGVTLVVFLVMALSPGGVGASLISEEGGMRPEQRKAMRQYYNRQYGLNQPVLIQYGRWLNHVSPLGFKIYDEDVPETEVNAQGRMVPRVKRDKDGNVVRDRFGDEILMLTQEAGAVDFRHPTLKWPDLGKSFVRDRPVVDVVLEALPVTLTLNLIVIPIVYGVAVTSGVFAARHRGKLRDVGLGMVFLGLWSIPTMWAGVLFIGLLANKNFLQWFPTGGLHDPKAAQAAFLPFVSPAFPRGWLLDSIWHLILPVVCLTYGGFAFLSKLMRSAMLENLSADFVRTARAKGVDDRAILYRHVLRNSVLPLITVAAGVLPALLGGSVIVESIFSLNGMGKLMIDAITARDREIILADALVIGALTLVCLLIADLLYAVADPRVAYE